MKACSLFIDSVLFCFNIRLVSKLLASMTSVGSRMEKYPNPLNGMICLCQRQAEFISDAKSFLVRFYYSSSLR